MNMSLRSALLLFPMMLAFSWQGGRISKQQFALRLSKETQDLPTSSIERTKKVLLDAARISFASSLVILGTPISELSNTARAAANLATEPEITKKVYLDIKIANYTEESVGKNRGAIGSGRIVFGLYGKVAPNSVERFLELVSSDGEDSPSYARSQFSRITDDGLLEIEKIRGLDTVVIAGSEELEYNGKLMQYKPILDTNQLRHDRAGLLTRAALSSSPDFAITTKASAELDTFHIVFGRILEGQEVLEAIKEIPLYSYKTSTGYGGSEKGVESGLADSWFESQKNFYVNAGKAFGDKRAVDRRGKLLRRVTIVGCGVL